MIITAVNEINGPVEEAVFSVILEISFLRGTPRMGDRGGPWSVGTISGG